MADVVIYNSATLPAGMQINPNGQVIFYRGIVLSGLMLHIDATNPLSNPVGTSSLFDLSDQSIPISLVNPANLVVTKSDGYVYINNPDASGTGYSYYRINDSRISSITDEVTLETVFQPVSYLSGAGRNNGCPVSPRVTETGQPVGGYTSQANVGIEINVSGAWVTQNGSAPSVGLGKLSTVTWTTSKSGLVTKAYVDAQEVITKTIGTGSIASGGGLLIGRTYYGGVVNANAYFIILRYYNRALTPQEIFQNYMSNVNSLIGRSVP